ncbi:YaaR family protein [Fictibacillus iocasae]|uniref:YaaR family protein n=1 Tax=Fictibacillus iocasae TaxID=2715437 RepID=A0ABW2NK89_9BACL
MKIGHDPRPSIGSASKDGKQEVRAASASFGEAVTKQQDKMQSEQLNRLLGDIESQGKRLLHSQTVKDLQVYKSLVQRFVKEAVDFGLQLKQNKSWGGDGRQRTLKVVKETDEKLMELTSIVLEQESRSVQMLDKIGEIKGLLINLYT